MTIILFLVVLAILIFVHELGHFLVAKKSGIRVDEFAIGFPPKIISWVKGETKYILNLIPFGGYVKIFGENPDDESMTGVVCVLVSGVFFNVLFAWILISVSFMFGSLVPIGEGASDYSKYISESHIILTGVAVDSPAQKAGLMPGDILLAIDSVTGKDLTTVAIRENIELNTDNLVNVTFSRAGEIKQATITPELSKIGDKKIIGIMMENVGVVKLNLALAFWEGGKLTVVTFGQVAEGLGSFLYKAVKWQGDFSQVSGPVGIVGLVGDAAHFGLAYFLGFVAFISLNLAVINLIPFPALDGGRVLFIIIEAIIRRPIKPKIANLVNTIGFFILIGLMLVITYRDIVNLF